MTVLQDNPLSSPANVIAELESVNRDYMQVQQRIENAARTYFQGRWDAKKMEALAYKQTEGTVDERRHQLIERLFHDDGYRKWIAADVDYQALKEYINVLSSRASVLQTLSKTHREAT